MLATLATIIYVFVYFMGNIGVARFFTTVMRKDLNVIVHIVFPIISTIALFTVLYYSLVPLPAPPVGYAPIAFVVLMVLGLWRLVHLKRSGSNTWKTLSKYVVENDSRANAQPDQTSPAVRSHRSEVRKA